MTRKGVLLVVEDSPESLLMLTDTLATEGYEVRPADSGGLALASVSRCRPELILLDIRMPGMDGFDVCRHLKADEQTRDIPVIFLSAVSETEDRVEGLRLGAVDFVSKPFRKEELLARIATHLELSRLRMALEQIVAERTMELKAANERLSVELAERIRAEQALRESEERFRAMANAAPAIVWTTDANLRHDFFNQQALDFSGRKLEQLVGDGWKAIIHPEDLERDYLKYIPLIGARREYRAEFRILRADGEYRWVLDKASPRFLADGAFAGYVGVSIDITDFKRNQEQLAATQKLESVGVLVAGLAHNFNNLLGTILAEADLATADIPADSPAIGSVTRIGCVATRASEIVALLMAYAGAGSPETMLPVNVNRVVEETVQLLKGTVARRIAFTTRLAKDVPLVRAEISRLRQVVMNLLTNATEAVDSRTGSVAISTARVCVEAAENVSNAISLPPGNYVRLEVTDTGCGIPHDAQARIFDPFYTTKFLGRGLGLSAVQGIVRSHHGAINVRSAPGQGSTFEILLPCLDDLWDQ